VTSSYCNWYNEMPVDKVTVSLNLLAIEIRFLYKIPTYALVGVYLLL
jgi:hypothetical protein